jgi:hypothetical protein|tara:strand:+ start:178 stop:453 length:276 start_codon:yes stop_codon:yes gene_type:complete
MIIKILGFIDLSAAFAFLMLTFGMDVFFQFLLFCSGLLFMKGLFVFTGDILSGIDLVAAMLLIISIFFTLPSIILWIPAFLLLAKGFVSFI